MSNLHTKHESKQTTLTVENRNSFVFIFWVAFLTLTSSACSIAAQEHEGACRRMRVSPEISYIRSAVWVNNYSEIAITDPVEDQLVVISPTGQLKKASPLKEKGLMPFIIPNSDGGYIQITTERGNIPSGIRWFNPNLEERGTASLSAPGASPEAEVGTAYKMLSVLDFTIAGDQIFAYGAFGISNQDFYLGFFRHQLRPPWNNRIIPRTEPVDYFQNYEYYALGNSYIASIGRVVYFLRMEIFPSLYRHDTRTDETPVFLSGFPIGEKPLPVIDASLPTPLLFMEIENMDMPAGLFSQNGLLYLLRRSPGLGGTLWSLTQMRPGPPRDQEVEVRGTVILPTTANHVTILPGPEWVVLEKSSVDSQGRQDISSMLLLPARWIEDPGSSPLSGTRQVDCLTDH